MKQIITCPTCLINGTPQNLAEILPSGYVAIARQNHRYKGYDYTVVTGNFDLICGNCGAKVLERREIENPNFGIERVHRLTVIQAVIGSISPSSTNNTAGTLSTSSIAGAI